MKKFLIIFCAMLGMSAQAQTTMDILTSVPVWRSGGDTQNYSYRQFTRVDVVEAHVLAGEAYSSRNKFYLSDTEDSVFDHSKVGQVNTGRYIVIERPGYPPHANRIESLDAAKLETSWNSKGVFVPWVSYSTFYANITPPKVDVKIMGVDKERRYGWITGEPYINPHVVGFDEGGSFKWWMGNEPMALPCGWTLLFAEYYTQWSERSGAINSLKIGKPTMYAYQCLDGVKLYGLRFIRANDPKIGRFARLSSNEFYLQTTVNGAEVLIFFSEGNGGDTVWLHIAALTEQHARFVFSDFARIDSIDLTPGAFRIVLDQGEIYERNGGLYYHEG